MTFLAFTGLINFITSLSLALFVAFKRPADKLARAYVGVNLIIAFWAFTYYKWQCAFEPEKLLWYFQLLSIGGIWINQAFLNFVVTFLDIRHKKYVLALAGIINSIFSYLIFSGGLIKNLEPRFGLGYWPNPGPYFIPYLCFWHLELIYCFGLFARHLLSATGLFKEQLKYMMLAFAIGYFGGVTNWPMWFKIYLPPYTNCLVAVYIIVMAYAIMKHHLMDINVAVRKTAIYSAVTALLTALYVLAATLITYLMQGPRGSPSLLSVSTAACIVAILSIPLHRKIQSFADRHFFRGMLERQVYQQIASGVAHEVKRPLANIALPAELALMDIADMKQTMDDNRLEKLEERVQYILKQAMEAGARVEAIREVSRPSPESMEPQSVYQLFKRYIDRHQTLLEQTGTKVQMDIPESAMVKGNVKQLEIVFGNLMRNAVEAMKESLIRELKVSTTEEGSALLIRIRDTGPGIAPEHRKKLFTPYFSTKGSSGTGMGLFLCQQIIENHEGTIAIDSSSSGTTFVIRLPKA